MATQEISRVGWPAFCDNFSRQHDGWRVDVVVRNGGERTLVRDLPFAGVSAALSVDAEDQIQITAGDKPGEHISHTVHRPARMWLDQSEDGADKALRIESSTGTLTEVLLYCSVPPERLNGL